MSRAATSTDPGPRRKPEFVLLRLLPHDSPVHRLWAGTKLLVVAALALMLSIRPTWPALGVAAAVVAAGVVAAKVPAGAVPRLPRWIFVLALADAAADPAVGDAAAGSRRVGGPQRGGPR